MIIMVGCSLLIYPLKVTEGTVWKEIPFSLLAIIALGIIVNGPIIDGEPASIITRSDGLLLLLFFIIFLYYSYSIASEVDGMENQVPAAEYSLPRSCIMVILGFACLTLGGKWIVDGAVKMATALGIGQDVIGSSIVAFGTSLPELATSAAAYKKKADIAVGNVVGSNIFNILFVLGISSVIRPLPFQNSGNIDIAVVIFASLLLFFSMFTGKKHLLERWEGAIFLVIYLIYIVFLLYSG